MGFKLRQQCGSDVVDYNMLMWCLRDYKAPHRKITQLLSKKILIRIKKGLYVFDSEYRQAPISKPYLANLIYGPSYVSQESALGHYGLIPEKVQTVTSITTRRNKVFDTPIGRFQYTYLNARAYHIGIKLEIRNPIKYLIAEPEKALVDVVAKSPKINNIKEMQSHLFDDLRIDESDFNNFDGDLLFEIDKCYKNSNVQLLINYFKRMKNG